MPARSSCRHTKRQSNDVRKPSNDNRKSVDRIGVFFVLTQAPRTERFNISQGMIVTSSGKESITICSRLLRATRRRSIPVHSRDTFGHLKVRSKAGSPPEKTAAPRREASLRETKTTSRLHRASASRSGSAMRYGRYGYFTGFVTAEPCAVALCEVIACTFSNVSKNSDRRSCSCFASVGSERNATFTMKRFNIDATRRSSECCERRAVSCRRISMRSMFSRSDCLIK